MQTYFIRHTEQLDIDTALREWLWEHRVIAIHNPHNKSGPGAEDSVSTNPDDYAGPRRSAMKALVRLAEHGGYVCAQYLGHETCLVGKVPPGSPIQLVRGKWGTRHKAGDREAVLKGLRLENVHEVDPCDSPALLVGRPQQGTIMRWPSIGKQVENLVEGIRSDEWCLTNLTPTEQEVLCSEFLRTDAATEMGLPKMAALLLPVGRTMKDIDIYGVGVDGRTILAQVTFSPGKKANWKADRLKPYKDDLGSHRILFCQTAVTQEIDGIRHVSVADVVERFRTSELGKLWFEQVLSRRRARRIADSDG